MRRDSFYFLKNFLINLKIGIIEEIIIVILNASKKVISLISTNFTKIKFHKDSLIRERKRIPITINKDAPIKTSS